ncbi:5'/3'-nucleotidase SurE [Pasteurellaceae bacterium Macca]|nr:5'/3'-nucleotidase SurE [Pasteurellaceae bacterium Macca]
MNILISNDDGFNALGIQTLAKALRQAEHLVTIVAPDRNRSAASSCLTLVDPLRVHRFENGDYSVVGTPADCVHLTLNGFLETPFDLVISGINHGANLGDDVVYSGTVAAALEGRHLPLPSIAISLVEPRQALPLEKWHFATAAQVVLDLLNKISVELVPTAHVLNVNVPNIPYEELTGVQATRLGKRTPAAEIISQEDPRGHAIYWLGKNGQSLDDNTQGTDFYAIAHNAVSITPLHADMTAYSALNALEEVF